MAMLRIPKMDLESPFVVHAPRSVAASASTRAEKQEDPESNREYAKRPEVDPRVGSNQAVATRLFSATGIFQMPSVCDFRPCLRFVLDQRFGQESACILGLTCMDQYPLGAGRQDAEAELRAVHAERL